MHARRALRAPMWTPWLSARPFVAHEAQVHSERCPTQRFFLRCYIFFRHLICPTTVGRRNVATIIDHRGSKKMFALWQFPPHSITLHLSDSRRRWHQPFRCFGLSYLALISQHRELATTIASYVSDESFILILTSLSWDCLYRNRLHRTELLIYLHCLREYEWTIWREEEQRREIEEGMDRMFGPSCYCPQWY